MEKPNIGRAPGVVYLEEMADHISEFVYRKAFGVQGCWWTSRITCSIVNVYSQCDVAGRKTFWDEGTTINVAYGPWLWCFMGDFNEIRRLNERKGSLIAEGRREMREFNWFIDLELYDLSLVGRRYT